MSTVYATTSDLTRLAIPAAAISSIDSGTQSAALAAASAVADGYLNARFTLPLTAWGDDLRLAVCQLAAWRLLSGNRGLSPDDASGNPIRDAYKDALTWLQGVAAETVQPVVTDSAPNALAAAPQVSSLPQRGWQGRRRGW